MAENRGNRNQGNDSVQGTVADSQNDIEWDDIGLDAD